MGLFENIFISLFEKPTQVLIDKLRSEPEMAKAIKDFNDAKIRLDIATNELDKNQKEFDAKYGPNKKKRIHKIKRVI